MQRADRRAVGLFSRFQLISLGGSGEASQRTQEQAFLALLFTLKHAPAQPRASMLHTIDHVQCAPRRSTDADHSRQAGHHRAAPKAWRGGESADANRCTMHDDFTLNELSRLQPRASMAHTLIMSRVSTDADHKATIGRRPEPTRGASLRATNSAKESLAAVPVAPRLDGVGRRVALLPVVGQGQG